MLATEIGLERYDWAPIGNATCLVCGSKIAEGSFRLLFRRKRGTALRDQLHLHRTCIGRLPLDSRAVDLRLLQRWGAHDGLSAETLCELRAAATALAAA